MKLVRYSPDGNTIALGSLVGDHIRCLASSYERYLGTRQDLSDSPSDRIKLRA